MVTRAISLPRARAKKFYVGLALGVATIAFVGFWPTYFGPLLAVNADHLPLIHFHAAVYVGWLLIFVAQVFFAARGRIDLHMKLGKFGIGYGVFVILVGLLVSFGMFAVRVRAGAADEASGRLLGPLLDMVVFAPLFAAAVFYRRRPELHKRLMIVATTALLIAAVGRMRFLGSPANIGLLMLVWSSPILVAMAYDFAKRRVVHPVYVLGLVLLLVEGPILRRMGRDSELWRGVTARLVTLVN